MKTLSKTQYENESDVYQLVDIKLVDIDLPVIYFVKAAINIAKSVQHLILEENKEVCFSGLETAEKYLCGKATKEECLKAAAAAHSAFHIIVVHAAAYVARVSAAAASAAAASASAADDVAAYYAAAYYAARAAADVCAAGVYATASTRVTACDIFRKVIPWNLVCATQIAKCFGKEKDENFIQNIMKDEKLINYATILIEDENLRKEFQFLMKDYAKNENYIKN